MADHYLLASLAGHWRQRGMRVELCHDYPADADLCFLHHDFTVLEPGALPEPGGRPVINGRVHDVSKRRYSSLQLSAENPWSGPVIIKSNLNHYGAPERRVLRRALLERLRGRLADISWRGAQRLPTRSYPILNSIADVPDWVWESPDLLVEKFLPEFTRDGLFCVRGWVFCGDRGYAYRVVSDQPIVKPRSAARISYLESPPIELMRRRTELQFDYGKFDYVEHDGDPILLDANKTPVFRGDPEAPRIRWLSAGIDAFL